MDSILIGNSYYQTNNLFKKVAKLIEGSRYLETAQKRNQQRSRTIPPNVVEFAWKGAQNAKKFLKASVPSRNFHEIKNEFDGKVDMSAAGKLTSWANKLSPAAMEWIAAVKSCLLYTSDAADE